MEFTHHTDTICAIATPVGEGGIGIIKISGPHALSVAKRLFHPRSPTGRLESHRLYYGWIRDPSTGQAVDEVLLSAMFSPRTYTCEDVVEINCHSGYAVLDTILKLAIECGARLAEPGEFTRRAFLNGRLDLTQAEAVIELIRSHSDQAMALANRHLGGELRDMIETWLHDLLLVQSEIEAHIDFSEDLEEDAGSSQALLTRLKALSRPVRSAIEHFESARLLRNGLKLVLVGKPNVGKSSLLNGLVGRDRAIVTPHPGTTRDVIEESFLLSGVRVCLLDTAGIRSEPDEIELLGIERTLRSTQEADVVLWLIDRSRPLDEEDESVYRAVAATEHVILLNKADLPAAVSVEEVLERFGSHAPILSLSVFEAADIHELKGLLSDTYLRGPLSSRDSAIVFNARHRACLEQASHAIDLACGLLSAGGYKELVSLELAAAQQHLELIIGRNVQGDLLDCIFSGFCIGK